MTAKNPYTTRCMRTYPEEILNELTRIMGHAEFRELETEVEKICYIKNACEVIAIAHLCTLFGISTKTYYKRLREKELQGEEEEINLVSPPRQLLTDKEEEILIQKIKEAQEDQECLTKKDLRELATDLYYERTHIRIQFDRWWALRFAKRHDDLIEIQNLDSLDNDRAEIDPKEKERYVNEIKQALAALKCLALLINMDETGFQKRPDKGKRKKCLICKASKIHPYYRATSDKHHISVVTAITGSCKNLKPMVLSTRKTLDNDAGSTFVSEYFTFFQTRKGYATDKSSVAWLEQVLIPYVKKVRNEINDQSSPVVLVLDGLKSHFSENFLNALEEIRPVYLVRLPPHSSHFTQPLDDDVFAVLKSVFKSLHKNDDLKPYTEKLVRIKKAMTATLTDETILASWRNCGFKIEMTDSHPSKVSLDPKFESMLLGDETSHNE